MKIFVYSGTHWDREWYRSFQGFRRMLVEMTDDLLNRLEAEGSGYGVFHFDGQTVVLEDYLRIRPENKERLTKLIQRGKIVIGPWYDMPDEFLISGESMIKNLKKGMALARTFGVEPSHNAYICDIFGHSSQTPQIFAGMDLHNTVLGRGTNDHEDPGHFRWQALDGTEVLAYRLRDAGGYTDFDHVYNQSGQSSEQLDAATKAYVDDEIARTEIGVVCLFDAADHFSYRPNIPLCLDSLRRVYPDAEIYHTSIDEMGKAQWEKVDQMQVRRGELCRTSKRTGIPYSHVITNTLSSRYPIKKYNDINQMRLEKWASPLYALHRTHLAPGFLAEANTYLLKNHPHDSICGCSIDQVHQDMMCRFDQTRLLCDEMIAPYLHSLHGDLKRDALARSEQREGKRLRIFNPLPYRVTRTVTAMLHVPGLPTYAEPFGYEAIPAFRLYDAKGREVPYGFVRPMPGNIFEIAFEVDLCPCGVTELEVRPSALPTRNPERILTSPRSVETEHLRLSVNLDGTLDLTDKANGQTYRNLLTMIDDGEIGDGWFHCCPNIDTIVSPASAEIRIIENTAVRVTFRITQKMELPAEIDTSCGITRSENTVAYRIVHEVTVAKNDRGITVRTIIDNNAKDHRLRLRLPESVEGETYEAAQAFGYVTRVCGDDKSTADWKEYGAADRNMANICAKRRGNRGLAFVSAYGLHECGVWENGDIDVTLMRCFRKTVQTAGEPGGQLQERLEYRYRILPYTEADTFASLQMEQDLLSVGTHSVTVGGGTAVEYAPMLEVCGKGVIYSTANLLEDGASEVRVFNDSEEETEAVITLPAFAREASMTEIDGRFLKELAIEQGRVSFKLPPFRIATIRFA